MNCTNFTTILCEIRAIGVLPKHSVGGEWANILRTYAAKRRLQLEAVCDAQAQLPGTFANGASKNRVRGIDWEF